MAIVLICLIFISILLTIKLKKVERNEKKMEEKEVLEKLSQYMEKGPSEDRGESNE